MASSLLPRRPLRLVAPHASAPWRPMWTLRPVALTPQLFPHPRLLSTKEESGSTPSPAARVANIASMSKMLYMLNPMTVVFPPLTTIISHGPRIGVRYLYHLLKLKLVLWYQHTVMVLGSAKSYLPWPKFEYQPGLSRAPGIARDLHARMNTYLAEGDLPKLGDICTYALLEKYTAIVNARHRPDAPGAGKKKKSKNDPTVLRWDVLRYEGRPKLKSKATFSLPRGPQVPKSVPMPVLVQAVVRIRSVQRLARWRPTIKEAADTPPSVNPIGWEIVPGTEKVQNLTENVVIQRQVDSKTYKFLDDWKVWGTIGDTQWSDIKDFQRMQEEEKRQVDKRVSETLHDVQLTGRKR